MLKQKEQTPAAAKRQEEANDSNTVALPAKLQWMAEGRFHDS